MRLAGEGLRHVVPATFGAPLDRDGCGRLLSGRVVQLVGRRLIAEVSEHLKPGACLRIDCEDALVLGEILGCWREKSATFAVVETFAAVELLQALTGL